MMHDATFRDISLRIINHHCPINQCPQRRVQAAPPSRLPPASTHQPAAPPATQSPAPRPAPRAAPPQGLPWHWVPTARRSLHRPAGRSTGAPAAAATSAFSPTAHRTRWYRVLVEDWLRVLCHCVTLHPCSVSLSGNAPRCCSQTRLQRRAAPAAGRAAAPPPPPLAPRGRGAEGGARCRGGGTASPLPARGGLPGVTGRVRASTAGRPPPQTALGYGSGDMQRWYGQW